MDQALKFILNPEVLLSLIQLVRDVIKICSDNAAPAFQGNLQTVKIDLGIIHDVLKAVEARNQRNLPDGIQAWKDEASDIVQEAKELLERIKSNADKNKENNNPPPTNCLYGLFGNKNELDFSSEDAGDLESLKVKLENISKHNQTVLQLLPQPQGCRCSVL